MTPTASDAAGQKPIILACSSPGDHAFARAFCAKLAAHLEQDLKRSVQNGGEGLSVEVVLRQAGGNQATAEITAGGKTVTLTLNSYDSGLDSGSARLLVYPIAQQLGLL